MNPLDDAIGTTLPLLLTEEPAPKEPEQKPAPEVKPEEQPKKPEPSVLLLGTKKWEL